MQDGKIGAVIVMIALIGSALGGFILNAEDVTSCNTDMRYITDIAGAFSGDNGDIEVDYNPPENLTGYTVFNPTSTTQTTNTIHGINYKTTGANGYWMDTDDGNSTSDVLTFTNNKPVGSSQSGTATMHYGSNTDATLTIGKDYALDVSETKTQIITDSVTHTRVAAVSLADIIQNYPALNTNKVILTANNSVNAYPGFVANADIEISYVSSGTDRYVQALITYENINSTVSFNPRTGTTVMGGQTYATNEIMFVWGESDVTVASVNMVIGSSGDTVYLDPVGGVQPTSVHQTASVIVGTTSYADSVTIRIDAPSMSQVQAAVGSVAFILDDETVGITYSIFNKHGDTLIVYLNNTSYSPFSDTNENIGFELTWTVANQDYVSVRLYEGSATKQIFTIPIALPTPQGACRSATATISDYGSGTYTDSVTATVTNNTVNRSTQLTGNGTLDMSMLETTYETQTIEMDYTTTYWTNLKKTSDITQYSGNTKLSMLFKKPTSADTDTFIVHLKSTTDTYIPISVTIGYDTAWTVNGTSYGNWPAMMIHFVISDGKIVLSVQPVNTFVDFTNYTLIDRMYSTTTYDSITDARSIQYMEFQNTDQDWMYHEIVDTTVLLVGGGLYIQNGVFNLKNSFPNDELSAFRLTTAAHAGESMTIRPTSGVPYTMNVNSDGTAWIINDKEIRFADVWLYYASADIEPVTIGDTTYAGALYLDGQIYEKGHLYLKPGSGDIIDLGTSTNEWTITLNGTWAPATAYYTGSNQAETHTEFTDLGVWQWDSSQFIIFFIGILAAGSIVARFKFDASYMDWIIVICAGVISFIVLG